MIRISKLVFIALILSITINHWTEAAEVEIETEDSQDSVSSSVSKGPTYDAEMQLQADDKGCVESATVEGNGVSDTLKLPCTKDRREREIVNEKNKLVIGGEPGDKHGILGNKPNSLVVLEGGKCVEKSYPPGGIPKDTVLSGAECAAARKDMQDTKKEAKEKEEKQKKEFENIGRDLDAKTMDLKINTPALDLKDPFKLDFGIKI